MMLHDYIIVKETELNCEFLVSESFVLIRSDKGMR